MSKFVRVRPGMGEIIQWFSKFSGEHMSKAFSGDQNSLYTN